MPVAPYWDNQNWAILLKGEWPSFHSLGWVATHTLGTTEIEWYKNKVASYVFYKFLQILFSREVVFRQYYSGFGCQMKRFTTAEENPAVVKWLPKEGTVSIRGDPVSDAARGGRTTTTPQDPTMAAG